MKPSAAALRLCHAVGLATRVRVGRWVMIDTALAYLSPADRESEEALLEAGVASGLVMLNDGPTAHSIKLTAAGLDLCRAAGGAGGAGPPQNGRPGRKRREPSRSNSQ